MSGTLRIVATPIGNLDDLSPRARKALEAADLVACEDTRRTGNLLRHLGFKRRLISLHEHNERLRLATVLAELEAGQSVALVSDAGMPLVSDPGFLLVREATRRGIPIEPVPGPSAALTALVVSALPPLPFTIVGFPPPKTGKRKSFFGRFAGLEHTWAFFESPHRLVRSLEDAVEVLGDRPACLARELTKMHEEVVRGRLAELLDRVRVKAPRGEYVVLIGAELGRDDKVGSS